MRIESVYPGKIHDGVGLVLAVAQSAAGKLLVLKAVGIRIERNLVIVLSQRCHQAQLVRRVEVKEERSKPPVAVLGVVSHFWRWSLQPQVAAVCINAGVIREPFGVAAEVELVVGLVEVSETGDKFCLVVTFEAGA